MIADTHGPSLSTVSGTLRPSDCGSNCGQATRKGARKGEAALSPPPSRTVDLSLQKCRHKSTVGKKVHTFPRTRRPGVRISSVNHAISPSHISPQLEAKIDTLLNKSMAHSILGLVCLANALKIKAKVDRKAFNLLADQAGYNGPGAPWLE